MHARPQESELNINTRRCRCEHIVQQYIDADLSVKHDVPGIGNVVLEYIAAVIDWSKGADTIGAGALGQTGADGCQVD